MDVRSRQCFFQYEYSTRQLVCVGADSFVKLALRRFERVRVVCGSLTLFIQSLVRMRLQFACAHASISFCLVCVSAPAAVFATSTSTFDASMHFFERKKCTVVISTISSMI